MTESEIAEITSLINTGRIYQMPREQLQQLFVKMNSPGSVSCFGVSEREGFTRIIENALQSGKVPNPTTDPADNKPPTSKEHKEWYQRPIGIIGLTIFAGIILALHNSGDTILNSRLTYKHVSIKFNPCHA
jgi:hypothetical protein